MRFVEPRQGRGPRLPRAGRAAVCGCVIGVGLSQFFYPMPRPERTLPKSVGKVLARPERVTAKVISGSSGPEAENLFRIGMDLLIRIAQKLRGENTSDEAY
jgi:hypothetical protein